MTDASQITPERRIEHWKKTSKLMWTLMFWWFVFSFGVHLFAVQLNSITVFGFPIGFYMAAQASLIAFVVLCVWNAKAQNRLDEEYGVAED
jgi:putative solute:sodium symporter small subunit